MSKLSATGLVWSTSAYNGGNDYNAVTSLGDAFVAVGDHDFCQYESPALFGNPSTHQQNPLRSLAWSGTIVAAVGDHGELVTARDGLNWQRENPIGDVNLRDVIWDGGHFIAVGEAGAMFLSTNGRNWIPVASKVEGTINAVCVHDEMLFLATAEGQILRGLPAAPFSRVLSAPQSLADIASGPRAMVAVGAAGLLMTSLDGSCWQTVDVSTRENLRGVTAGDDFAAVGDAGTILYSPDGLNWVLRPSGPPLDFWLRKSNNLIFALGSGHTIFTSTDGRDWTPADVAGSGVEPVSESVYDVAYGNGRFLAVDREGQVLVSTDGSQWTVTSIGAQEALISIVFAYDKFFIGGNDGTLFIGPDENSLSASAVSIGEYPHLAASVGFIASLGGADYYGGGSGKWTSDGVTWNPSTQAVSNTVYQIIATDEGFLTASRTGVYKSTNGDAWTYVGDVPFPAVVTIAKDGDLIAVAGAWGQLSTTTDGHTWHSEDTGVLDKKSYLWGVDFVPGGIIAAGENGLLLYRSRSLLRTSQ